MSSKKNIHTISASEMREINRSAILELIRTDGPIARSQIAEELEVSLPTVMRIVDVLIGDGLVIEDAKKEWSGGRKRTRLLFNGKQHLALGIDLGGTKIYGAIANLNGEILIEINFEHHRNQAEESFELLCEVIDQLLDQASPLHLPIRGISLGVPGIVEPETGLVKLAPALNWIDFPLKEQLTRRYSYPIAVENDVNLAALGEMWFGCGEEENNLVLLTIGTGVGAGVIVNGVVYTGSHNMAGEVGYFLPDCTYLGRRHDGFGAFEQLASGSGIAARARQSLRDQRPPEELEALTSEEVFTAARRGESWATAILAEEVDYLAHLVAAISAIFDPTVILLGGGVSKSADLLIDPILKRLEGVMPRLPELRASRLDYRASIMGSIVRLLRITANYCVLQKFS